MANLLCRAMLLFTVFSFLGWLCESIVCSVPAGKPINRGFLFGPCCPVYGVGGLILVRLLSPLSSNLLLLYLAGTLLTSVVEYCTGFLLEKLFDTKWWDYSHKRFQLHGRICLKNALLFGLMGILTVRLVAPSLEKGIARLPASLLPWLAGILAAVFVCDTYFSVRAALSLHGRLEELQQVLDEIRKRSGNIRYEAESRWMQNRQALDHALSVLRKRQQRLEIELLFSQRRLLNAFPHMRRPLHEEPLFRMRRALKRRRRTLPEKQSTPAEAAQEEKK